MFDEAYLKILRNMTPEQKMLVAEQMHWDARKLKAAGFRMQHPDWTEDEVQAAVREMILYGRT